jgi:TatD DNase family protein
VIDSHAHLDMLDDVDAVLARAHDAGVDRVIAIGDDAPTSEAAATIAAAHPNVWCTAGLHPHHAKLAGTLDRVEELARAPRCVGVGEAGLDYYYDHSPREDQRRVFAAQIRLATTLGKTLVIHTRDSWPDTFAILRDEGPPARIVFHCWTGGPGEADQALALGAYLSFSGIVTFPNAQPIRDAAARSPLDRILIETDSPFLAPVPHRGKRNEPAYVAAVLDALARLKDVPRDALERATIEATRAAFALP